MTDELTDERCEHVWSEYKYPSKWPTCLLCDEKWPADLDLSEAVPFTIPDSTSPDTPLERAYDAACERNRSLAAALRSERTQKRVLREENERIRNLLHALQRRARVELGIEF